MPSMCVSECVLFSLLGFKGICRLLELFVYFPGGVRGIAWEFRARV